MRKNRIKVQRLLETLQIKAGETPHVYYQPPETVKMVYPCFVYNWDDSSAIYSNDKPYLNKDSYSITYITKSPEPQLVEGMRRLPRIRFVRHFTADNLHHFVFTASSGFGVEPDALKIEEIN